MLHIVFLDRETISPHTCLREPAFPHTMTVYPRTAPHETAARIADADIVITNKVRITAEAVAAAPRLAFVAVAATGFDCVDVAACAARNIPVSNIRDYAGVTVPEHVFALLLALSRNLVPYRDAVIAGRWQQSEQFCFHDFSIHSLRGATLGVVGRGALGRATARLGEAFGMRVQFAARKDAASPEDGRVPFETFLSTSDVITLHCPLTPETRGLIGDAEFARMHRRPILINVGRGGLVDESALARALHSGAIRAAGFDVTAPEPPPADSTLMQLVHLPNFLLTPHVAWAAQEGMQVLADQLIDNLEAFHAGAPQNRVA